LIFFTVTLAISGPDPWRLWPWFARHAPPFAPC
jgi:hypothetical protein